MKVRHKNGIELICAERQEQVETHGYDADHDGSHTVEDFELAISALVTGYIDMWPWEKHLFLKMMAKKHNDLWACIGALTAAKIDRFNLAFEKGELDTEEGQIEHGIVRPSLQDYLNNSGHSGY